MTIDGELVAFLEHLLFVRDYFDRHLIVMRFAQKLRIAKTQNIKLFRFERFLTGGSNELQQQQNLPGSQRLDVDELRPFGRRRFGSRRRLNITAVQRKRKLIADIVLNHIFHSFLQQSFQAESRNPPHGFQRKLVVAFAQRIQRRLIIFFRQFQHILVRCRFPIESNDVEDDFEFFSMRQLIFFPKHGVLLVNAGPAVVKSQQKGGFPRRTFDGQGGALIGIAPVEISQPGFLGIAVYRKMLAAQFEFRLGYGKRPRLLNVLPKQIKIPADDQLGLTRPELGAFGKIIFDFFEFRIQESYCPIFSIILILERFNLASRTPKINVFHCVSGKSRNSGTPVPRRRQTGKEIFLKKINPM